ncbi:homeobox protein 2 isoform X2 [Bombyx mori]|uniref:Chitin-binding type-2 domain-containing protein n=1 Tax=Bombyx mori TaxID=7091 RepID=A0A8R1WLC5_BOMMO|nr:homeobox protein 2 isoform X2 [Bombyx mori]
MRTGGRRMRTSSQFLRDAHRENMSPLWILLTLLPVLGGAERFNCKGRILGAYYADAKSGCKAFHVCVRVAGGGIRDFRFFCPPGTLFHQEAQTCTDWGDDDPLACPADIYDGYDTRKLSSPANREEETEFGLQRAETGDRRLSQNNGASNGAGSDLRAAHSSDFFTGQRDRGRDDPVSPVAPAQPTSQAPQTQPRQSFRRATLRPKTTITAQYTTVSPPLAPQPSSLPPYETSKRKLVRKRPVPVSSSAPVPTTYAPNLPSQQPYFELTQQNFNRRNPQNKQSNTTPSTPYQNQQTFTTINVPTQRQSETTPNLPPQFREYKDEYVEVSRVTPKQNRFYNSKATQITFPQTTAAPKVNKKQGLVELYNNEGQSTAGYNLQNDNRSFKVRNGFNVDEAPRDPEFNRNKNNNGNYNNRSTQTTASNYNNVRNVVPNTPPYKNYNSVPYEPEKNNVVPYSKTNYFNSPATASTTISTTLITSTYRPEPPANLNKVAYNTNIGFNAPANNYDESGEDDGQYRPPQGEDDGLYRPELYDRELLSGAHSLNIAASGNRLPEERKKLAKTQSPSKLKSQTSPRPFRPAPTPVSNPPQTTRAPELPTTTVVPQTISAQRTFDYYQTYTTTSRPSEAPNFASYNNANAKPTTNLPTKTIESRPTRPHSRGTGAPVAPTISPTYVPRPTTKAPHFAKPSHNKEDTSYDYAYYDSDPGFSEYDQIEEFGRTKVKT